MNSYRRTARQKGLRGDESRIAVHCFKEERVGGSASLATDGSSAAAVIAPSTMTQTQTESRFKTVRKAIFELQLNLLKSLALNHQ